MSEGKAAVEGTARVNGVEEVQQSAGNNNGIGPGQNHLLHVDGPHHHHRIRQMDIRGVRSHKMNY